MSTNTKAIAQIVLIILANVLVIFLIKRFAGDSANSIINYSYGLITILFVLYMAKQK